MRADSIHAGLYACPHAQPTSIGNAAQLRTFRFKMQDNSSRLTYYEANSAVHSRAIQGLLGRRLRTMYELLIGEGVPDRFKELLRQLDLRADEGER